MGARWGWVVSRAIKFLFSLIFSFILPSFLCVAYVTERKNVVGRCALKAVFTPYSCTRSLAFT